MKNKKILFLSMILVIAVVSVVLYFTTRPQQELLPQTFAQLPKRPKLVDEFHQNTRIYSVAFSPTDSSLIALVDVNGTIKLWNRNITNKPAPILSHPSKYSSIEFSPTGELLASIGGGKLVFWDVASGNKINTIETAVNQFTFSPNGKQLAGIPHRRNEKGYTEVRVWDIWNPKKIMQIATLPFDEADKAEGGAGAVDISSDGKWIAVGYSNGTIHIRDLHTQQLVTSLETSLFQMNFLKFSPNNKYMVTGGNTLEMYSVRPKGYIMWDIPSWKRTGEVLRGNVENLVFSPDGKICASVNDYSGYGRGVEIWSTVDGAPITSLQTEARDVSFSQDGNLLATGGRDGIVRVWELTQSQLDFAKVQNDAVRLIYFLPKGKEPSPNITQKIDKTIRKVQKHYADEMERHGFGRKTFTFETDQNGKAKIYQIDENQVVIHDLQLNDIWLIFVDDSKDFSPAFMDNMKKRNTSIQNGQRYYTKFDETFEFPKRRIFSNDKIGMYDIEGFTGNGSIVYPTKKDFDWRFTVYRLKHLFNVLHRNHHLPEYERNVVKRVFKGINSTMPWGKSWVKLSKCEAEWLDKSRFFNPTQPYFDKRPDIEMNIIKTDTGSEKFQLTASDGDGIHQLQLFVTEKSKKHYRLHKLQGCQALNGNKKATVEFEMSNHEIQNGEIRMIDIHGNIASREFIIQEKTPESDKKP